jgi:hypothetical protein
MSAGLLRTKCLRSGRLRNRCYASAMKLRGGEWSKGDIIALLGLVVALAGVIAAILAVPGMPKLVHFDSEAPVKSVTPATKSVAKSADVTSGQVNFGCDQTLPVETPVVRFGKNPRDISAKPAWANTDNVKTQNQSVANIEDAEHRVIGLKASGSITGRDRQNILGVMNCPGGGHGELTLHVTWTQDE